VARAVICKNPRKIVPRGTICKFPAKPLIRLGLVDYLNLFKNALANFGNFIFGEFLFFGMFYLVPVFGQCRRIVLPGIPVTSSG